MEKYDIVGIKKVDFNDDNNKHIQGTSVFIVRDAIPSESESVVGRVAEKIFIDAGRSPVLFEKIDENYVGETAEFVYSPNGRQKPILTDILVIS